MLVGTCTKVVNRSEHDRAIVIQTGYAVFFQREALWWWGLSMQAQNDWETYYRHCQGSCFWGWILLMPLDASVKVRVCEELHAASASRMSLCWLVFRQASEAFSSSSRAMRLAVTLLFHCWKSVTCCTLRIRDAVLSCIVPYLWPSLIYRST